MFGKTNAARKCLVVWTDIFKCILFRQNIAGDVGTETNRYKYSLINPIENNLTYPRVGTDTEWISTNGRSLSSWKSVWEQRANGIDPFHASSPLMERTFRSRYTLFTLYYLGNHSRAAAHLTHHGVPSFSSSFLFFFPSFSPSSFCPRIFSTSRFPRKTSLTHRFVAFALHCPPRFLHGLPSSFAAFDRASRRE